ncbi:MAG TPA: NAD(P)H-hydrate dehydratase [Clostridiales bacterium]|nr:NAD(P)H-hydrate dehydratase [Clostridiales bacterium]
MRLIDGAASREMDREALTVYGLDTLVLMENAGLRSADFAAELLAEVGKQAKVAVICGKGNNGGDGLVLSRHLFNRGFEVEVFCLAPAEDFSPAAKANLQIVSALSIKTTFLHKARDLTLFRLKLMASSLIVDAIFGSGFQGEMEGLAKDVVNTINGVGRPVLALDIPSGVNADNGETAKTVVAADHTVAFALPKLGNVLAPGGEKNGTLQVVDISFPPSLLAEKENDDVLIDEAWALTKMKPRKADSHKGIFGHILVVGGSANMTGSLILAGKGALKAGAGLVTYMMPKSLHEVVKTHNLEAMTFGLPENADGSLGLAAADPILQQTGNKVLVLGMGLSRTDDSMALVKKILESINCPLVLDADALLALGELNGRKKSHHPLVLTPHPGEMSRMLGWSIREVQENRLDAVRLAAEKYGAVVVLKGSRTLIASPEGKLLVNCTGNAGMATGGMGDVLSGIIGALLGQGLDALTAAALGVYFHGLAGDTAALDKGEMGLNAGDIIGYLPGVLAAYEQKLKGAHV